MFSFNIEGRSAKDVLIHIGLVGVESFSRLFRKQCESDAWLHEVSLGQCDYTIRR